MTTMTNSNLLPIDLNTAYVCAKDVVSRRNQDGTIILMRLDETSLFYKIDGAAAFVWADLEAAKTPQALVEHFGKIFPAAAGELQSQILNVLTSLAEKKLITSAPVMTSGAFKPVNFDSTKPFAFGTVKEFNLEQIETEVLNESIYLDVFAGSDLRLKKDIEPIRGAIEKIEALEGVTYLWDLSRAGKMAEYCSPGKQVGLVAQQVAQHMPELVCQDEETSFLAVNYTKLTAYLLEAIKDLNRKVDLQDKKIREMEANLRKN